METSPAKDKERTLKESYQALSKRCLEIQKDNEALVARLHRLKRLAVRVELENRLIKRKIDSSTTTSSPNKSKKHTKDSSTSLPVQSI